MVHPQICQFSNSETLAGPNTDHTVIRFVVIRCPMQTMDNLSDDERSTSTIEHVSAVLDHPSTPAPANVL